MIAIFGDPTGAELLPKDNFIRIKNVHSIRGRKFIGCIFFGRWYEDSNLRIARDVLMERQPELNL